MKKKAMVSVLFAVLVVLALFAEPVAVSGQTVPPVPDAAVNVFLPQVTNRSYPLPVFEQVGVYWTQDVDTWVYMGGEPDSKWEYMHASIVLTVRELDDDGTTSVFICWYGKWPSGAGAAKCDRYEG